MKPLSAPVRPFRGFRNTDTFGSGAFGSNRDGGLRHHLGADILALPGDAVESPLHGTVKRLGKAYAAWDYGLVELWGSGEHEGLRVLLLYVKTDITAGALVHPGSMLGVAQDLGRKYPAIKNHIHCEIWQAHNPADLLKHLTVEV